LTLPFVIRAAVIEGVATATEVSTVGVVYTALLGLEHLLKRALLSTARSLRP
jgi:TRAP-type C4-dicarboxylate transport system permease large subunit